MTTVSPQIRTTKALETVVTVTTIDDNDDACNISLQRQNRYNDVNS